MCHQIDWHILLVTCYFWNSFLLAFLFLPASLSPLPPSSHNIYYQNVFLYSSHRCLKYKAHGLTIGCKMYTSSVPLYSFLLYLKTINSYICMSGKGSQNSSDYLGVNIVFSTFREYYSTILWVESLHYRYLKHL